MKKLFSIVAAVAVVALSASVFAETKTTTPTTNAPATTTTNPQTMGQTAKTTGTANFEEKARETCKAKGFTGAQLDDCVKTETTKLNAQKTNTGN